MSTVKIMPVETIAGMWNGFVVFEVFGCKTEERVHVGLKDAQSIRQGANPKTVVSEIIANNLGYKKINIIGVKPDRQPKKAISPFSK
jgi:hypothetical protein